jgi:rRNA maturation endonuclease Nob1
MAKKTATLHCTDCSEKFTISSQNLDSITFCPFCGEQIGIPTDDVDYDDDEDESDDED